MTTITSAIEGLATFAAGVSGLVHSYDPATTPGALTPEILPCAITIPVSWSWKSLAFQGKAPEFRVKALQILFYLPSDEVAYYQAFHPLLTPTGVTLTSGLMTLADNYGAQLASFPFLANLAAPITHVPVSPEIPIRIGQYAGVNYHVLEFNYDLVFYQ